LCMYGITTLRMAAETDLKQSVMHSFDLSRLLLRDIFGIEF